MDNSLSAFNQTIGAEQKDVLKGLITAWLEKNQTTNCKKICVQYGTRTIVISLA